MKATAGETYIAIGNFLRIRETPTLTGRILQIVAMDDIVGVATGNSIIAERYEDTGEPIEWVELAPDPYGYPPLRYVASRYIKPKNQPTQTTVTQPVSQSDNTNTATDSPLGTDSQIQLDNPNTNNSTLYVLGGLVLAVFALFGIIISKK